MGKIKLFLIIISLIFPFLGSAVFANAAQGPEHPFQKGVCYVSWDKERYMSVYSDKSLEKLAQIGVEWVGLVVTYYQDRYDSKQIFPTEKTPSDKSLTHVIRLAHKLGMKVMLKPHIDLVDTSDGLWRGDIGFQNHADWQEWFLEYRRFISHYAGLAEETNTELFCIGTELCFASQKASFWKEDIIPAIRKVYSGRLVYAANWDEYKNISFWEDLDYVGIDAYFPLTQKANPEYGQIRAGWQKWVDEIEAWQESVNKPVIFTEIGYRSCGSAAKMPWDYSTNAEVNLEIQANCYKAVLDVLYDRLWCKGLYWWYWGDSPFAGGMANRDFTPQNKPAEKILSYYYKDFYPAAF